jgi:hypothetical protein
MGFTDFKKKYFRQTVVFLSCLIAICFTRLLSFIPMPIGIMFLFSMLFENLMQLVIPFPFLYVKGFREEVLVFPFYVASIITIINWGLITALFAYLTQRTNHIRGLLLRAIAFIFCAVCIMHIIFLLLGWSVDFAAISIAP